MDVNGVVLSGEGLRVANDRLSMVEALQRIDMLQRERDQAVRDVEVIELKLDGLDQENSSLRMRLEELGPHL